MEPAPGLGGEAACAGRFSPGEEGRGRSLSPVLPSGEKSCHWSVVVGSGPWHAFAAPQSVNRVHLTPLLVSGAVQVKPFFDRKCCFADGTAAESAKPVLIFFAFRTVSFLISYFL